MQKKNFLTFEKFLSPGRWVLKCTKIKQINVQFQMKYIKCIYLSQEITVHEQNIDFWPLSQFLGWGVWGGGGPKMLK